MAELIAFIAEKVTMREQNLTFLGEHLKIDLICYFAHEASKGLRLPNHL